MQQRPLHNVHNCVTHPFATTSLSQEIRYATLQTELHAQRVKLNALRIPTTKCFDDAQHQHVQLVNLILTNLALAMISAKHARPIQSEKTCRPRHTVCVRLATTCTMECVQHALYHTTRTRAVTHHARHVQSTNKQLRQRVTLSKTVYALLDSNLIKRTLTSANIVQ